MKILVSIPALSNRDISHLAKVDEHTGLCGLTTARNSLICSSSPPDRKDSVLCSYARKVCIGQSLALLGKAGKKNSALGLPCLVCFARPDSWNTTPSGVYLRYRRSSITRSADLDGLVRARIIASFQVRFWSDRESELPRDSMWSSTLDTSHVTSYRGLGGR